jgi:hypothetical protein
MQARNPKKWLKQTGQASIEYTLVSILAVFILIKPDDQGDVPIVKLANALKTHYNAYAYAISMSDTTTLPSELIEIIAVTAVTGGGGAVQNPVTPRNNAGSPLPDFIPPGVITPPPASAPITPTLSAENLKAFVDVMNDPNQSQEIKDAMKVTFDKNFGVGAADEALKR